MNALAFVQLSGCKYLMALTLLAVCSISAAEVMDNNAKLYLPQSDEIVVKTEGKTLRLVQSQAGAVHDFGRFSLQNCGTNEGLAIRSTTSESTFLIDGFKGWAIIVPQSNSVSLNVSGVKGVIDVATPTNNQAKVSVVFPDGATASIGSGSSTRFDQFLDGSYYFAGTGKVSCVDADGHNSNLHSYRSPMTGGPVVQVVDSTGGSRMQRLTPASLTIFSGNSGTKLDGTIAGEVFYLGRDVQDTLYLPNGTHVRLANASATNALQWVVAKGFLRIWVGGVDCWNAMALTDQSGSLMWNSADQAVDLLSTTPTNTPPAASVVVVTLARGITAGILPNAAFQYQHVSQCTRFLASAYGGEVSIYNDKTKQIAQLAQSSVMFNVQSVATTATTTGVGGTPLSLGWQANNSVTASATGSNLEMQRNTTQSLELPDGGRVNLEYTPTGELRVSSVGGNYQLRMEPLENWSAEMPEGNTIRLQLSESRTSFTAIAPDGNTSPIKFVSPDGFTPVLMPGGAITIIMGSQGSYVSSKEGSLIFTEGAGAGGQAFASRPLSTATLPGSSPLGISSSTTVNPGLISPDDRIKQTPVSVYSGQ